MSIGQNIKCYREYLSMSVEEFARQVGISVEDCGLIESGRRALTSAEIQKIGEVLDVTFDDLLASEPVPRRVNINPDGPEEGSVLMPMDELKNLLGKMQE